MRVAVNEGFIEKKTFLSRLGTWGGLAILLIGFVISLLAEQATQYVSAQWVFAVTWAAMIIGISAFNIGRYNAMRWVARPREEEIIAHGLKGLDHRYRLLNYMRGTPAYHILAGPPGIYVLHVRRQDGTIVNRGDRWTRKFGISSFLRGLFDGGLGNPSHDAMREAYAVKKHLGTVLGPEEAERIPLHPVVLFMDARVKLEVIDPIVPVLTPRDLRSYMRKQQKESRLAEGTVEQIYDSFAGANGVEGGGRNGAFGAAAARLQGLLRLR